MPDSTAAIFEGLNPEQTEAVATVTGPVVILAGAGSGKTTTVTRRIANQVLSRAFRPAEILAVTFTQRAAGEMGERLGRLGVTGVRARTFHSAALALFRQYFQDDREILGSKARILVPLASRLPMPHKFVPVSDLAGEIERAKNRRVGPEDYVQALAGHEPVIPPPMMARLFADYERIRRAQGLIDFEDMLAETTAAFRAAPDQLERFRDRVRAFTVDEYQDVNLLQQELLDTWLGDRDDICVVGDDYQSIYSFTGATPRYLLDFAKKHPGAAVFKLVRNYRSTPEVIALANKLTPSLGGTEKQLLATREPGPGVVVQRLDSVFGEVAWMVGQIRELVTAGIPEEEIAVLYRLNAMSEELEEELSSAHLAYQVKGGAFLRRAGARDLLVRLRRPRSEAVSAAVEVAAREVGWKARAGATADSDEATRQQDLARLVRLAKDYRGDGGVRGFVEDLQRRFSADEAGSGVQLLTYHRAKGLEFDAVFLPRLNAGEMPDRRAKTAAAIVEERRLFYVGVTRARRNLFLSWGPKNSRGRRSMFLDEVSPGGAGMVALRASATSPNGPRQQLSGTSLDLAQELRSWRTERARADVMPAYVILHDSALEAIARAMPASRDELLEVPGMGPVKFERYGQEILAIVAAAKG
ncbi:MAG TPA: ATP-dependent DNA helicase UvrD2 [Candidatus Dormibacteraeota bacterium]|nr:ATP-dependent DNA helicase UvrD2 [Candidatus Dormibacteraeota bacterium]